MKQYVFFKIFIVIALILLLFLIFLVFKYKNQIFYQQKVIDLNSTEINEYKGEKLSSLNDFRENSIKGPQYINKENYHLKITGLVSSPQSYTYDEIIKKYQPYQKVVILNCVEGWSVKVLSEGLLIKDLIETVEPLPTAKVVIFKAYDGYSTSFPLDYLIKKDIIIAYKINGVVLPPERGFPFQLMAEDKWGYKWIKWITEIEFSNNLNYQGYWEQRGYSNAGNLGENFLGK